MPEENQQEQQTGGFLSRIMSLSNDSIPKTVLMTVAVCVVCAVFVATSAVVLKQRQETNKLVDKQQNILQVAGLDDDSMTVEQRFELIETRLVDLDTGEYVEGVDPAEYDERQASKDPEQSIKLTKDQDIASIGSRAKYAKIYLVKPDGENVSKIVLPVHGYGLWSTLYGFVSLETDGSTVYRLKFYDHAETPGLGGEVDNPSWRSIWKGKKLFNDQGEYELDVIKGAVVTGNPNADYQVDGLAGATLTSRGVENLFKYWFSDQGYALYLDKWQSQQG